MAIAAYPSVVAALLRPELFPPLGPGQPNHSAAEALRALTPERLVAPYPVPDLDMARAALAGLWLYHNFLDESHQLSQDIDTPTGSYWHGILHRREPDPSNAKYWFRRVGNHPVLKTLVAEAPALGFKYTNPAEFVDFCERVRDTGSPDEDLAKRVQQLEWQLLFDFCYQAAISP